MNEATSDIKFVVGLGNPGSQYEETRHNAGAMFLAYLQKQLNLPVFKFDKYANALISSNEKMNLVFPQTYMNLSGEAVTSLKDKRGLAAENILVVHDEKDIPFGEIRFQRAISSAGHNGVQSVIDHLNTNIFWRLRIGIGPVPANLTTDVFVLQKFSSEELNVLREKVFYEGYEKIKKYFK